MPLFMLWLLILILGYSCVFVNTEDMLNEAVKTLDLSITREQIDFFVFDVTTDGYTNIKSNNRSIVYKENKSDYYSIWLRAI